LCLTGRIRRWILGEDQIGQRLETFLLRDGGTRAFLRAEWQVDIFECRQRLCGIDGLFQLRREQVSLLQRCEDCAPPLIDGTHLLQTIANGENLNFIELAGDLFAVASDERHRSALGE
jgi:hypothetical protein